MSTSSTPLPWLRFWCLLGSTIDGEADGGGFLTDPTGEYGRHANQHLHPLTELLPEVGAIALCGEPGLGKTTELACLRAAIGSEPATGASASCWLDFQEVADFTDFRRRTVESAAWQQWRQGQGRFTLVVDGVDEGMLQIRNFVNALSGLLRDEPRDRLRRAAQSRG